MFAQACVEQNGFTIQLAVGYIRKPKDLVAPVGTTAMEVDENIFKVTTRDESFTIDATETTEAEVRTVTYISLTK